MRNNPVNEKINPFDHIPVLLEEAVNYLEVKDNHTYLDGTFGMGGYSSAILSAAKSKVIATDRDPEVKKYAKALENKEGNRFKFIQSRFSELDKHLSGAKTVKIDGGMVFDFGLSSMQINDPTRGFSFIVDGPLDMRMSSEGITAKEIVNNYKEKDLVNLIRENSDEKYAKQISRAICLERKNTPIENTTQLAKIVRRAQPKKSQKIDTATRTFQALRMVVNEEQSEIKKALEAAEKYLLPGARLVVVSFHSIEDRIVKKFLRLKSRPHNPSRHLPINNNNFLPSFSLITRRVVVPSKQELIKNNKSRSARLRTAVRLKNKILN